jgi:hypothetical protein
MRRTLSIVAVGLVTALAAGCGGSSSGGTTPASNPSSAGSTTPASTATAPADTTGATTEIKANWAKFFNYKTPRQQQIGLLEDGDQLGPAIRFAAKLQKKQHLKQGAKVTTVTFTSPTNANVGYKLLNGSTPLLNAASGVAILVDGTWKVSKLTFCTLVTLGNTGKPVPSC